MPSQAIGVDIGSHAIKVAVLQRKGAVTRALRLFRAPLGGDTDPVRIRGALARAGITGKNALLGITGRDLIIRYTHVPPVPDWRLHLLMQFEINEVSGQSGGEVAADYRRLRLPVESDEETVLVALARNTWLGPRIEASRGAGLKAGGGCPNSVAVFNAFLAHGSWKEGETTLLVSLGRENIDMAVQRDGELLFARNMAGGGQLFTEAIMQTFGLKEGKAEKNKVTKGDLTPRAQARYPDATAEKLANAMAGPAGQLVSMIQSSVMIARAQTKMTGLNVDRLVLTGGGAQLKGIAEYFRENMSVAVDVFDPVAELDASALPAEDAEGLETDGSLDFAAAVGLAETMLRPAAFRLEVLPESERKKRRFVERTVWALGAAAAALVLVVLLFRTRAEDIARVVEANEGLEREKGRLDRIAKRGAAAEEAALEARRKEVALRARLLAGDFGREVLALLYENHADHIYLDAVDLTTDKVALDLQGRRQEARAADDASPRLEGQTVWPKMIVQGFVQPEYAQNPGETVRLYNTALRLAAAKVRIQGRWGIAVGTTAPDARHRFQVEFRLEEPAPVEE